MAAESCPWRPQWTVLPTCPVPMVSSDRGVMSALVPLPSPMTSRQFSEDRGVIAVMSALVPLPSPMTSRQFSEAIVRGGNTERCCRTRGAFTHPAASLTHHEAII
jgi:hypothetical protein